MSYFGRWCLVRKLFWHFYLSNTIKGSLAKALTIVVPSSVLAWLIFLGIQENCTGFFFFKDILNKPPRKGNIYENKVHIWKITKRIRPREWVHFWHGLHLSLLWILNIQSYPNSSPKLKFYIPEINVFKCKG